MNVEPEEAVEGMLLEALVNGKVVVVEEVVEEDVLDEIVVVVVDIVVGKTVMF